MNELRPLLTDLLDSSDYEELELVSSFSAFDRKAVYELAEGIGLSTLKTVTDEVKTLFVWKKDVKIVNVRVMIDTDEFVIVSKKKWK